MRKKSATVRLIQFRVPVRLHKRIGISVLENDATIQSWCTEAAEEKLAREAEAATKAEAMEFRSEPLSTVGLPQPLAIEAVSEPEN